MISKANIQWVKGLQVKKQRQKYDQFTVEGEKSITELLKSNFTISKLFAVPEWIKENKEAIGNVPCMEIDERELARISSHKTPQKAIAVVNIPEAGVLLRDPYVLALDEIQDPGNLGTIIRIADWFGLRQIICSKGCTDVYAPKCINASMGSFLRVHVEYRDILDTATELGYPILLTSPKGLNIHKCIPPPNGIIVIGNEGHGINPDIVANASLCLSIPGFGKAESLNAAVSSAIVLDNIFRALNNPVMNR